MRVLIIHSINNSGSIENYNFIQDQANALKNKGIEIDFFGIKGKGFLGYLSNRRAYIQKIHQFKPDIVHAHYGLSGALAILQHKIPVVVTFHNGETLSFLGNLISSFVSLFSSYNIFVADHIRNSFYVKRSENFSILPCGVDLHLLEDQKNISLENDKIHILFGGSFSNERKNVLLARNALSLIKRKDIDLIELKGWSRQEVFMLLKQVNCLLLTSKSEGSPQIIKEALACNCPIVSTNIADIEMLVDGVDGCFLTTLDPIDVAEKIEKAIAFASRTEGIRQIEKLGLDNGSIAEKLIAIYNKVLKEWKVSQQL